jgi:hypothetical protein
MQMLGVVRRYRWYRARLAAMSRAEVAHRFGEQGRRAWSRVIHPMSWPTPAVPLPGLPNLRNTLPDAPASLLQEWQDIAEDVGNGRYRFLGVDWPDMRAAHGECPAWHLDPTTGRSWPADRYCFSIGYRDAPGMGDVKHVWELNRLQYLQPLAALAARRNDRAIAELVGRHVESWIDANPPFRGVNWASGIELALRLVSLLTVTGLIGDTFNATRRAKLWRAFASHGYWLMRYPSRFSSANNHLVAEAGALYVLGALAPKLPHAARWTKYGRATVLQEAQAQILADGVGAEQSPTYQAFTMEWLLLVGAVARTNDDPLTPEFWRRLTAAAEFLSWITDSGGHQPQIGDDDEGRVFASRRVETNYVASVMGAVAAVTSRALKAPEPAPHLRDLVFGRPTFTSPSPVGVQHFDFGGYTVMRARERDDLRSMLVFDHGPLGYLSIAAHGHADALSLWLHIGAVPVLVDAGTYLYHAGGKWREHFRSTAAHNTLVLNGTSSSQTAGAFNWSKKADTTAGEFDVAADGWRVSASHDGYRQRFGFDHHRGIERKGAGPIIVTDWLEPAGVTPAVGPANVEIGFLINPALAVVPRNGHVEVQDERRTLLTIAHEGPLQFTMQEGLEAPVRGWHSPSFGTKLPAPRIVFRGTLAKGARSRLTITVLPSPPVVAIAKQLQVQKYDS